MAGPSLRRPLAVGIRTNFCAALLHFAVAIIDATAILRVDIDRDQTVKDTSARGIALPVPRYYFVKCGKVLRSRRAIRRRAGIPEKRYRGAHRADYAAPII